jgi:hypothetical protein
LGPASFAAAAEVNMGAVRRCCGIDVHKKSVMVHVLPPEGDRKGKAQEREFRTFSRDLRSLRAWLKRQHVTEVVMESTGQYWRPLWNILEGEVARLVLVNPAHVKALAGRKTERIDSQRLARYLENQDLDGSFVPGREIRELRDLTRSRVHLLLEVNRVKNRITQLCEAGNIKVSSVASDLFGVSGRRMLAAVAEGRRDPSWMADYACGNCATRRMSWNWRWREVSPITSAGCWAKKWAICRRWRHRSGGWSRRLRGG